MSVSNCKMIVQLLVAYNSPKIYLAFEVGLFT